MPSLGTYHTVLLRSDGGSVSCGDNSDAQRNLPHLEEGATYTQVSAGDRHTVCLRHDGMAAACGWNGDGQCDIPDLEEGVKYTQISAGHFNTGLLRSDGKAEVCGDNTHCQCDVPELEDGAEYTQVSVGYIHTVLLRGDGQAVACGQNGHGQCKLPELKEGVWYTQISAGMFHTALLRSDGIAVSCGGSAELRNFPVLEEGAKYTQVSAGLCNTALLRHDGIAIVVGENAHGQCDIPTELFEGSQWCTQVVAGRGPHTGLLLSDGSAVVCGPNHCGECNLPTLEELDELHEWCFVPSLSSQPTPLRSSSQPDLVVQLHIEDAFQKHWSGPQETKVELRTMAGELLWLWRPFLEVPGRCWEPPMEVLVQQSIAKVLKLEPGCRRLHVVLRRDKVIKENGTVAGFHEDPRHRGLVEPWLCWSHLLTDWHEFTMWALRL